MSIHPYLRIANAFQELPPPPINPYASTITSLRTALLKASIAIEDPTVRSIPVERSCLELHSIAGRIMYPVNKILSEMPFTPQSARVEAGIVADRVKRACGFMALAREHQGSRRDADKAIRIAHSELSGALSALERLSESRP